MEYLRWILLGIGVVLLVLIFLLYSYRRDDEELSLKGGSMVDPIDAHMEAAERKARAQRQEPMLEEDFGGGAEEQNDRDRQRRRKTIYAPDLDEEPLDGSAGDDSPLIVRRSQAEDLAPTSSVDEVEVSEASVVEPSEVEPTVVTLFLVSRDAAGFDGAAVRQALLDQGLEFGDMQIYHYPDPSGVTLFSVMNAMAPGTFDPNDVASHATRGLAMFIRLPAPGQPVLVLENMITVAHRLADVLSADILDDQKQPLNSESIDRMRELVVS